MWWLIAAAVVLLVVLAVLVLARRTAARRRQRKLDEIRSKLKPGVRFEAYGSFGNIITGQVIKVIDSTTIEAWCRSYLAPGGETGRFPIDRIYEVKE